jgi:hypothetical protein
VRSCVATEPSLVARNVAGLLDEFADLNSCAPTVIVFGADAYRLAAEHVPSSRYSRLVRVTYYGRYISQDDYRARVMSELRA